MYLAHHGVLGQKWGVRRYQNPDGTRTAEGKRHRNIKYYDSLNVSDIKKDMNDRGILSDNPRDIQINKTQKYYRATNNPNENQSNAKRIYVSQSPSVYADMVWKPGTDVFIDTYVARRDVLIAGKRTTNKILKECGAEPIHKLYSKNVKTDNRDFMMNESKLRRDFINKLKSKGYDGIIDPVDSNIGIGYADAPIIFVDGVLKKIGQTPYSEFY